MSIGGGCERGASERTETKGWKIARNSRDFNAPGVSSLRGDLLRRFCPARRGRGALLRRTVLTWRPRGAMPVIRRAPRLCGKKLLNSERCRFSSAEFALCSLAHQALLFHRCRSPPPPPPPPPPSLACKGPGFFACDAQASQTCAPLFQIIFLSRSLSVSLSFSRHEI